MLFVEKDLILQEPTPLIGIENKIIVIHIFFYLFHGPGEDPPFSALLSLLEVIIFSSVWFLSKKPNRNWFKPTGFGLVFYEKTGSNWFGSVFCRFGSVFSGLGSVRF